MALVCDSPFRFKVFNLSLLINYFGKPLGNIFIGIFLLTLNGLNPYVYFMAQINNAELREAQFGEQMARLIIKISSVFTHPMIFGLFLGLAMVYLYSLKDKIKPLFVYLLMFFIVVCIFLCGIRTPIGAMFLTVFFYLLMLRRIKPMIYVAVIGFIGGSPSRVAVYPFYFG